VLSISASAVEIQASSGLPDRFLNPSTAIERRVFIVGAMLATGSAGFAA
jgi:hypothetical protein